MSNQCQEFDDKGVQCLHDENHSNGEYEKHKGSVPTVTKQGFKGVKMYYWKVK